MRKEDFVFSHKDEEHRDYWFKVTGETEKELTDRFREQSMVGVTEVVYSLEDGEWGLKRLFPWNFDVITPEDDGLHDLIKSVAEDYASKEVLV